MSYATVVVKIDQPRKPRALVDALQLVREDGHLHVVRTLPPRADSDAAEAEVRGALAALRELVAARRPGARVSLHARRGRDDEETLRLAVEADAELIVVGALDEASARTATTIVQMAACSVLVVEPSRERAEAEGLVPHFPICPSCIEVRHLSRDREWYCEPHRNPSQRLFAIASPPG